MSEMLLLGAGASVEAGVPDTHAMTRQIAEVFQQNGALHRHADVISFTIGGLLFQQGIRGNNPLNAGVNVEELFNAVQLLAERNSLEAAPFVGSWHAMVQEFDKIRSAPPQLDRLYNLMYEGVTKEILNALPTSPPAFIDSDIDRQLEDKIRSVVGGQRGISSFNSVGRKIGEYVMKSTKDWMDRLRMRHPRGSHEFVRELRRALESVRDQPGEGAIFAETAEWMIRTLADIVWIDTPDRVRHLRPLLSLLHGQQRLTITTLNYDNGVELLAHANGAECNTGINDWSTSGLFMRSGTGIFLLKLHGSINWALHRNRYSPERPMPHSTIEQVDVNKLKQTGFRPAVIFGQRNKLTAEGPFLDLLRAFQQELSLHDVLTVVGYSFRDRHVNEYVAQWLNGSSTRRIRIIGPNFDKNQTEFAQQLVSHCGSRLEIIAETAGNGLNKLYGGLP